MIAMLAGFAIAAGLWWGLKAFGSADPRAIARLLKHVGGGAALLGAAVLLLRGRFDMALLLTGLGVWLLGWSDAPAIVGRVKGAFGPRSRGGSGSRWIALARSPAGHLVGSVLDGPWKGRSLDTLSSAELAALRELCRTHDPEGVGLVDAYLDGRGAGRREDAEPRDDPRARRQPQGGAMTEQEAYQILGVEAGADGEAIRRAHRGLMKKLHPDQGGSTYLASRINQARDLLLDRHR